VRKVAEDVTKHFNAKNPLDVFMCNAGILDKGGPAKSACGTFERTLMVNVIAPHIFIKKFLAQPARAVPKKICVTSSWLHNNIKDPVDMKNLNFFNEGTFNMGKAYF